MTDLEREIEATEIIEDILKRGSLSWKQKIVLINSLTTMELNEIFKKEKQNE